MTVVVPVTGSSNWDVPLDLALTDLQGQLTATQNAESYGLASWSLDPATIQSTGLGGTSGTLYLQRVNIMNPRTLTKLLWGIDTVGVGPVAGQNFVGLYSSAGVRLASVGVDARVTTTGLFQEVINVAVVRGFYWTARLINAGTMPLQYRGQNNSTLFANMGVTAAQSRFASNGVGLTSLPANITPASNSQNAITLCTGVA